MTHQFLREPALFPARMAGETWGSERCDVELAGELFRIEGLSALQLRGLADRYGARLHPSHAMNVAATLQVFRAPASDFVEIDTRGWEYWVDLQWSENGFALSGMRVMARAELDRAGIWTSVEEPAEFSGVVENVLRPLLAARLLANGGLLVHSAAVDGYLFAGRSGAGKSTIARLALDAGRAVLSDDLNAIVRVDASAERRRPAPADAAASGAAASRPGDAAGRRRISRRGTPALLSEFVLEPLPFTGDLDEHQTSREQTPLRAVLALEKSEDERVRAMSLADTVSLLVRCAPYVNQDPSRLPLLLERASEIAHGTARGVLAFRRDGEVWPILDAGLVTP